MRVVATPLEPQCFNDGLVTFYQTYNTGGAGNMPRQGLRKLFACPFAARKISDDRYYSALQYDLKMERVIRCPRVSGRLQPAGDIAIIAGENTQYRVEKVAESKITNPDSMDVTLSVSKKRYVIEEGDQNDGAGI